MRPAALCLLLLPFLPARPAGAEELFNTRVAVLEEFPREVARGKAITLAGTRKGDYASPSLIVIGPNGRTSVCLKKTIVDYRFEYEVEFDEGVGPYRFELYLTSPARGGVSAARFTIWYGKRKPAVEEAEEPLPTGPPTPLEIDPRLVEKRYLARLNEFRRTLKLDPVGWNEAVAARARDHASKMARAKRRVHKFGGRGVLEMLRVDGAGTWAPWSGPAVLWGRVVDIRPFPRPAVRPPGPGVNNHVVQFVSAGTSLAVVFETYYVREAAHRVLAADPNCVEVGVGCAREVDGDPRNVYYCICFVQANEKPVVDGQESAFARLKADARKMDPEAIRRLGFWSRPKPSASVLKAALRHDDAAVRGAGLDAWLLLDEEQARKEIGEIAGRAEAEAGRGKFGEAYREYAALSEVTYDRTVAEAGAAGKTAVDGLARAALASIRAEPEDKRDARLREFRRAIRGMPLEKELE